MHNKIKDITLCAICTSILVVQEQILAFLPNIQLTLFLMVVFSKKLGLIRTIIIITCYTLIDGLIGGPFNIIYITFMLIGWLIIPILLCTIFKKVQSPLYLALIGVMFAFTYSWINIIPNLILTSATIISYLIADYPFELLLAASSFLSILWLYTPIERVFKKII
ncbi:MAG: hypothetical protein IKT40_09315 [Bacilli bacterium]|nr:hypothetical protein [Bacilli bacterium]